MTDSDTPRPTALPVWQWEAVFDRVEVRFFGRGMDSDRSALAARLDPPPDAVARLVQVHSDRVRIAVPGLVGEGDALVSGDSDLALAVATADCVPVLLAAPGWVAAVHAGWRGLVAGVIGRTLDRATETNATRAWIGPAIGRCCYEVSERVAAEVVAVSTPEIVSPGRGGRPHIDLRQAATRQLHDRGVDAIHQIDLCTRCHGDKLWSYRRDGSAAGRNWAVIWRHGSERTI